MTRRHVRLAHLIVAATCLGLVVSCQAPGGPGYSTMRFAVGRQGSDAPLTIVGRVTTGGTGAFAAPAGTAVFEVHHPAAGPGEVTIGFDLGGLAGRAAQRRLLATVADIDYVIVTITPVSGAEVSQTVPKSALAGGTGSVTFAGLPPVAATATIKAYDGIGNEIGKGTQPITISASAPTVVNFSVTLNPTYLPPTGTVTGNINIVDGPVVVGTPPPGTVFKTGQVIASNKTINSPEGITFDAAGTAWIPSFKTDTIVALDTRLAIKAKHLLAVPSVNALNPTAIAFDATGGMWVANYAAASLAKVDPATGLITKVLAVGPNPADLAFGPTGTMHVLLHPADSIVRFTTAGLPAGAPIVVGPPPLPVVGQPLPKPPFHLPVTMKIAPSGEIWVANLKSDTVSRIGTTGVLAASIPVGDEPEGLAFDAGGNVWVTNNRSGTVMKINPTTNLVVETYPVGQRPRGLAFDKNGSLWVACSEASQVWKLSPAGVVLGKFPVAADPRHVAVDAAGAIWVASHTGNTVQKLAP
jgi:YVTN family beta-propeller protein